jgi:plasmid stability protein
MSMTLLIPDDLHEQLSIRARQQHASIDALGTALIRDALTHADGVQNQLLHPRHAIAMKLFGMGKHWSAQRDAVAELIAERVADDGI